MDRKFLGYARGLQGCKKKRRKEKRKEQGKKGKRKKKEKNLVVHIVTSNME